MLVQSWTSSGDKKLDEIIRNTQLKAIGFDSRYYIEWIPYNNLMVGEKIGEGGFAAVYQGEWLYGPRFIKKNIRYYLEKGPVALKKLNNSQKNIDELLKEVN